MKDRHNDTLWEGEYSELTPSAEERKQLQVNNERKTKPKPQCMFAMLSNTQARCTKPATHKYGEHWFCAEHGSREKPTPTRTPSDFTPGQSVIYIPPHACNDPAHPDCVPGMVTAVDNRYIFVKFTPLSVTAQACLPAQLL